MRRQRAVAAVAGLVFLVSAEFATAQSPDLSADVMTDRVVRGKPLSADGATTMSQVLGDGTRIERSAPSKFYRDSEGRVRREQTILGLTALQSMAQAPHVTTIVDPVAGVSYVLQPGQKVARREKLGGIDRSRLIFFRSYEEYRNGQGFRIPITSEMTQGLRKELGTRQVEGLTAVGRHSLQIIRPGEIGNDRQILVVGERWMSEELGLLLEARHEDPRTGTVVFRLTNIQQTEPPRELFTVPQDYRIIDAPPSARQLSLDEWREFIGQQHEALRRLSEETDGFAIPPPSPRPR